jgi:hypothetical protein
MTNSDWWARAHQPVRRQPIETRKRERLCTLRKGQHQITLEKRDVPTMGDHFSPDQKWVVYSSDESADARSTFATLRRSTFRPSVLANGRSRLRAATNRAGVATARSCTTSRRMES